MHRLCVFFPVSQLNGNSREFTSDRERKKARGTRTLKALSVDVVAVAALLRLNRRRHRGKTFPTVHTRLVPITQRIIGDTVYPFGQERFTAEIQQQMRRGIKACRALSDSVWRAAFIRGIIQILSKKRARRVFRPGTVSPEGRYHRCVINGARPSALFFFSEVLITRTRESLTIARFFIGDVRFEGASVFVQVSISSPLKVASKCK